MYVRNNANTCEEVHMFEQENWSKDYSTLCDPSSLTSVTLPSRLASRSSINNGDDGNLIDAIQGSFSSHESFSRPQLDGETMKTVSIPPHITLSEISGLITTEDRAKDEGVFELLEPLQTSGIPVSQAEKKRKSVQIVKKSSMAAKGSRSSRGPDPLTAKIMNTKELLKSYRIPCPSGSKDRHSKVMTSRGPRDRRLRLSVETAIKFFEVQDRLGFDQPSRAVEWLLERCQSSIDKLREISTAEIITNHCSKNEFLMNSSTCMSSAPNTISKSTAKEFKKKTREAKKPKNFTRRSALCFYDNIASGSSSHRLNDGSDAIGRYLMSTEAHDLTSTLGGMQKQLHNNNIFLDHRPQPSLDQSTNNCSELNLCFNYNHAQLQSSPLMDAHYYPSQQEDRSLTGLSLITFPVPSCPFPPHLLHPLTSDLQSTTTNF